MTNRHVVPAAEGWQVEKDNARRPSAKAPTQAEAIARAVEIVAHNGGGQVIVRGNDGEIRENHTVAAGDPHPRQTAAVIAGDALTEGAEVTGRAAAGEVTDAADDIAAHTRAAADTTARRTRRDVEHAAATADAAAHGLADQADAVTAGEKNARGAARDAAAILETSSEQITEQARRTGREVRDDTAAAAAAAGDRVAATAARGARAARKQADRAAVAGAGVGDELDDASGRTGRRIHSATEALARPLDRVTERALTRVGALTHALNPVRVTGRALGVTVAAGLHVGALITTRATRAAQRGVHTATEKH